MRIERLDLAPYGRFSDRRLTFSPTAALHVVLGANEAGKTTTLEAISDLLFGFPHGTAKYGFQHDQQLLRVGGSLAFADGTRLDVVRRKGRLNTLMDATGRVVADEPLIRAMAGIDREAFASEFGLTSRQLRRGGESLLAAGGKLAETLAAGSSSLSALSAAQKALGEQADALFTPRRAGSKPFYLALERHNDAAKALKAAVVDPSEWKAAETALEEAKLHGLDLRDRHRALSAAVARRKRAQRVRTKLAALAQTAERLAALGALPDVPATTLTQARDALAADVTHRKEGERLTAEDIEAARALADLSVNEKLIAAKTAVEALTRQIGAAENFERDLPHRLAEEEEARLQLDAIARKLGVSGAAALLAAQPTDAELARAGERVKQRERAQEKRAEALRQRGEAQEKLARLDAPRAGVVSDPSRLKRRLESFDAALEDAKALDRDRANLTRDARALAEAALALDPAVADLDALARAALPEEAELARRAEIEKATEQALRGLRDKLGEARRKLAAQEADLAKLETLGSGATRADWEAARTRREAAFDRLAATLDGPAGLREERFEAVRGLTLAADALAERALVDADRAARLQGARDELAKRRAEVAGLETVVAEAEARHAHEVEASRALWAPSGVAPHSPAKMAGWRRSVTNLLIRRAELETRRAGLDALAAQVEAARVTLAAWLTEAGVTFEGPFIALHHSARDRLKEMEAAWLAAQQVEIARAEVEKTLAGFTGALAELDATEATVRRDWPAAMARLGLRPEAAPEEAQAALAAWGEVGVPREKLRVAADRIEKIRDGLAAFEAEAAAAVAAAAPDLAGFAGQQVAAQLTLRLAAAEKAAEERGRLTREGAARAARRDAMESMRAALGQTLANARTLLGAEDDTQLEAALAAQATRAELAGAEAALRRDLLDIGDGLDEAALRAEQAEFDPASLEQEIAEAEQAQARLWEDYKAANEAETAAEGRLKALAAGRDAVGAARERAEAAGEIADIAESWLLRAAAAKLAARAIERHRAAAQDPLIARAGELFALATGGSFVGLGVDFDADDQPVLVGRREDGKVVKPEGLSEGALDQLYLSLRLALLERRAGEAIPFIGDDLLASFDDERTSRALAMLAEFGAGRQTILFTHHARVAELARKLPRDVDVLEM